MALLKPMWMQANLGDTAIEYSAQEDRAGLLSALFSREGVIDAHLGRMRLDQRAAGANFSFDVLPGRCAVFGDDVSDQGAYVCTITERQNFSTFSNGAPITAPASGTRTHRVVAQVRDKKHNGLYSVYDWTVLLLQDTGSGTPAQPNSAITLGFVRISAGQASIQTSHIDTIPNRASVGTQWLTGNLLEAGIHAAYGGRDATRPLTYQKSPDGFVTLSGFIRRTAGNAPGAAGQIYAFDGTAAGPGSNPLLPSEIRPAGIRDVTMMTDLGPCNLALYPSGTASFRFQQAITLVAGQTWFSFDGCTYRAAAFS